MVFKRYIFLLFLSLFSGTLFGQIRGDYTITGDLGPLIPTFGIDPDSLTLLFMDGREKLDTIGMHDGKFTYSGRVDSRYVESAYLRLVGPGSEDEAFSMTFIVFLEPGDIRIWCRELPDEDMFDIVTDGTPANERMSSRVSRMIDYNYEMLELAQDTTLTDEEKSPLIWRMYEQQDSLYRYFYRDNRESDIAPLLAMQQFYGTNDFEEAGRELAYLEARFPGHPDLHSLNSVWMSMEGIGVGDSVPDVSLTDTGGNRVALREAAGSGYVLVDFWSSLVGPSLDDLPALKRLPDIYNGLPLTIIGICTDNSRESWRQSLARYQPAGIRLWDEEHEASRAFHITNYPCRFLVDPEGTVVAKGNFTELPDPAEAEEPGIEYPLPVQNEKEQSKKRN